MSLIPETKCLAWQFVRFGFIYLVDRKTTVLMSLDVTFIVKGNGLF